MELFKKMTCLIDTKKKEMTIQINDMSLRHVISLFLNEAHCTFKKEKRKSRMDEAIQRDD